MLFCLSSLIRRATMISNVNPGIHIHSSHLAKFADILPTSGISNGGHRHPKIHPHFHPSVYRLVLLDPYVHSPSSGCAIGCLQRRCSRRGNPKPNVRVECPIRMKNTIESRKAAPCCVQRSSSDSIWADTAVYPKLPRDFR